MGLLFLSLILAIVAGLAAIQFIAYLRMLTSREQTNTSISDVSRYRPMLRLLSDRDIDVVPNPALRRRLRAERRQLFREYVRLLARDYGRLLAKVRLLMTQSGVDRPDLARTLVRHRVVFAVGLCRIEYCLWLHALGIDKIDFPELLNSLNDLRIQVNALADTTVWGS